MLKQILMLVLSVLLVFGMVACGSQPEPPKTDNASVSSIDSSVSTEEGVETSVESSVNSSTESAVKSESTVKTESKATAEVKSEEKTVEASVLSSSDSPQEASSITPISSDAVLAAPPIDDFYGQSVDELIAWLKNNQQLASDAQIMQTTSQGTRKLLVPQSVKEGLISGSISVTEGSNAYVYNFQTNESEINNENEHYSVRVAPLTAEEAQKGLTELYYPEKTIAKGTYQGIEYAYQDGYEGTDQSDRAFASAWFIQNGCVIKITAHWANAFKSWDTAWFDYFEFETITF